MKENALLLVSRKVNLRDNDISPLLKLSLPTRKDRKAKQTIKVDTSPRKTVTNENAKVSLSIRTEAPSTNRIIRQVPTR